MPVCASPNVGNQLTQEDEKMSLVGRAMLVCNQQLSRFCLKSIQQHMKKIIISSDAQDTMYCILCALMWIVLLLMYTPTHAQNVRLQGNTFIQQSTSGDSVATGYYYQDRNGIKHPIFLSTKGKAYCWIKSGKSGKMYRKYLPNITSALAGVPSASTARRSNKRDTIRSK